MSAEMPSSELHGGLSLQLSIAAYSAPKMNQICYLRENFPLNDRVKFQPVWSSSTIYKEPASQISHT